MITSRRSLEECLKAATTHFQYVELASLPRCVWGNFLKYLARPRRFERPTPAFGGQYSIQLSYGRVAAQILTCPSGRQFYRARQCRYNPRFLAASGHRMSENHTPEHTSLIKTPKQLAIVVVLSFIVPVVVIVMLAQIATSGKKPVAATAASEEAVARRIKPAGTAVVDPTQAAAPAAMPVAVAAPSAVVSATPAGGDAAKGKSIYDASCAACHGAGVAGAPKPGDKTAWAPRLKSGKDAMVASVIKGKGAMPPKGGNAALADADIKAAVDYLAGLVK